MKKVIITIGACILAHTLYATEPVKSGEKSKTEKKEHVAKIIKTDERAQKPLPQHSKIEKSAQMKSSVKQLPVRTKSKK